MSKIVCVSGGFDPIHEGHVAMIEEAAAYGAVVVALNSDEWLMRKKGFVFMNWEARAKILRALRSVYNVFSIDDSDGTVCDALRIMRPDFFANGGDRVAENTPELKLCVELGIRPIFNIGGGKTNSSSELVKNAKRD